MTQSAALATQAAEPDTDRMGDAPITRRAAARTPRRRELRCVPTHDRVWGASSAELWAHYKATGDPETRNRLVLQYAPFVKVVAGRMRAIHASHVEFDDLASWGIVGLMDAIERFEPGRGYKFETYAAARIRGAIVDELRADDWVPRSVRQHAREIEDARARLTNDLGRSPRPDEIAAELHTTEEQLAQWCAEKHRGAVGSLESLAVTVDGEISSRRFEAALVDDTKIPGALPLHQEVKEQLVAAINELPERERLILVLWAYEGMTLAAIGEALGITESRVSQIRSSTYARLARRLARRLEAC
jgi:RNA polymerase sigma factor for flagellar operon FliA